MQTQNPGYAPKKPAPGVKRGNKKGGVSGRKPGKNQVRKTSPYSKNRTGVKSVKMAPGYKSMMLGNPMQSQQPMTNNLPGFNMPGSGPML